MAAYREVPQSVNCELNLNRGGGLLRPNNTPSMRGIKTRFLGAALSLKVMGIHWLLAYVHSYHCYIRLLYTHKIHCGA